MQWYRPPLGEDDLPLIIVTNDPSAGYVCVSAKWFDEVMIEAGYIKVPEEGVIHV